MKKKTLFVAGLILGTSGEQSASHQSVGSSSSAQSNTQIKKTSPEWNHTSLLNNDEAEIPESTPESMILELPESILESMIQELAEHDIQIIDFEVIDILTEISCIFDIEARNKLIAIMLRLHESETALTKEKALQAIKLLNNTTKNTNGSASTLIEMPRAESPSIWAKYIKPCIGYGATAIVAAYTFARFANIGSNNN